MSRRCLPLLAAAGVSCVLVASSYAYAEDPAVLAQKEAALPPGVLPAWQTATEVAPPMPHWTVDPSPPLPIPPPAGFRVPAEFEPVGAFVVTQGDWSDSGWSSDVDMLIDMLNKGTVAAGAGAIVLTKDSVVSYESYLAGKGVDLSRVHVLRMPNGLNAKWARDFGPLSLYQGAVDGHLAFLDLHYYDTRPNDDAVVGSLAASLGLTRYGLEGDDQSPPDDTKLYLEGGNFQTDGMGTCIISNDVPSDNAKVGNAQADSFPEVEAILHDYLGCEKVIWLEPPPNTSTGHVDMASKLLTPTDILVIDFGSTSGNDAQVDAIMESNVAILQSSTNGYGDPFQVHRVRIPSVGWSWTYKTYTNATILNHVVMVPTYNAQGFDAEALDVYRGILGPDYTVVGIDSSAIVAMGGAVHCTTMQIASACGDGVAQDLLFEACDGQDLAGASCASLGFAAGTLACTASCALDTTGCTNAPEPASEPVPEAGPDAPLEASDDAPAPQTDAEADAIAADAGGGDAGGGDATHDAPNSEGDAEVDAGVDATAGRQDLSQGDEDGGCSCRQARSPLADWALPGFGLAALALLFRRRRG